MHILALTSRHSIYFLSVSLNITRNIIKKIHDEVTKDIFDTSNVRIFYEIETKKWRMFILCYVCSQLRSVKRLARETMLFQNTCIDTSRVQNCCNLAKTRVRTKTICPHI